ncbi:MULTISPECIES: PepSY domain-containing protein [unclassified Enterococcus]|uniref:PepSY domain-containing protein n=1 Tax=unclassified Enterococcus TaxID=2608891 RepID=UPI001CE1F0D6|nr:MULTISPECIES: PepSY domain-containing protein [unclassified Enterococcus]MCA5013897.1 PepSY domain-containing protein [Enterococcus sp. S23]MCA5017329.1 PepSY domain-containing protein [Enterococcus sp. S22(2020)]
MNKKVIVATVGLGVLLAGCTNNNKSLETKGQSKASTEVSQTITFDSSTSESSNTKTTASSNKTTNATKNQVQVKVSLEEAVKAYQEAYPNTAITSLDLDPSFGTYYYEIKGVDDSKEYEVKINAETGELKKEREETLDREDQNGVEKANEALDLNNLKSMDDISKIAVDSFGEGQAIEWSLERELSTTYWEVKVQSGNQEMSVKINAQTGDVLEKELDD